MGCKKVTLVLLTTQYFVSKYSFHFVMRTRILYQSNRHWNWNWKSWYKICSCKNASHWKNKRQKEKRVTQKMLKVDKPLWFCIKNKGFCTSEHLRIFYAQKWYAIISDKQLWICPRESQQKDKITIDWTEYPTHVVSLIPWDVTCGIIYSNFYTNYF